VTQPRTDDARLAQPADLDRMAHVLAAAFSADPAFLHLLPPGTSGREERLRRFFALELPRSQRLGCAWTTTDGRGAAIWYPPGQAQPPAAEALRQVPSQARIFGRRLLIAARTATALQQRHPKTLHWYLFYLAAEPGSQGTGIGTALLRPVLDQCDARQVPAYLEATSEQNRRLYVRHGFVDLEPFALPDNGPTMWPMWRDPQPQLGPTPTLEP
jgi:GNAT superfamily N-acetyltransferase